jgi:hypothetical protein
MTRGQVTYGTWSAGKPSGLGLTFLTFHDRLTLTKRKGLVMENLDNLVIDKSVEAPRYEIDYPQELWSEILEGLWIGGTDDNDIYDQLEKPMIRREHFDTVFTAYAWANPVDWFVKEIRYGFWDSHVKGEAGFNPAELDDIASMMYADWKKGKKVLFRCQAGLNRSSLCAALVLMKDGYTADDAIALIREKRSKYALFNNSFVDYLRSL